MAEGRAGQGKEEDEVGASGLSILLSGSLCLDQSQGTPALLGSEEVAAPG